MTEGLFTVAQLGARMRYAVPRILEAAGRLEVLYTDVYAKGVMTGLCRLIPHALRTSRMARYMDRIPAGIPVHKIRDFRRFGFDYASRRQRACNASEMSEVHRWAGKTFCELILERGLGESGEVYAFNSAALELFAHCRNNGIRTVLEQTIARIETLNELMAMEKAAFPEWVDGRDVEDAGGEMAERERRERQMADLIISASGFVKDSISDEEGVARKTVIVPYGVDIPVRQSVERTRGKMLKVLSVGEVGLRKGSPYVLAAARKLKGKATFRMVGLAALPDMVKKILSSELELVGPVPYSRMEVHYRWADVFLLPSLCEGSARAVYEAMSYGLPVICTHNTGSVVRNGLDGFVVAIRDSSAIVEKLEKFLSDPGVLAEMSGNVAECLEFLKVSAYGRRLLSAVELRNGEDGR
ncbi:MAG: hypothetical protein C0404_08820 [Verrucomicrobia bacterium]|nr:hypothetical protein [Verrucomicrobiota bacterium]